MTFHWLAAGTMAAVAVVHSILGERRLIGPLVASRAGVMERAMARQVLRFAWHLTSVLMLTSALTMAWPGTATTLIALIGAAWLSCGILNAVATRGRHIGWPFLATAGLFALAAAYTG